MRYRWSVFRANLDPTEGHEQSGRRPVLVVSNEAFNRRSGLVTVVPLTTSRRAPYLWEVEIPAESCGLPSNSIALPHQVRTIARDRLAPPSYGRIVDVSLRQAVADRILLHFGLEDMSRLPLEE